MERYECKDIHGCYVLKRRVFTDERGRFSELYRDQERQFVQGNATFNNGRALRGMHLQKSNPQGKLVTSVYGVVRDVLFDLRPDSPTFKKGMVLTLDWDEGLSVFVPPGVAHGFLAVSYFSIVHYACTTMYDKASDGGVNWESPEIKPFFQIGEGEEFIVSPKDAVLPTVEQYLNVN